MTGARRALVIAIGRYDDARFHELRAPAADATHLAEVLRSPDIGGFEVEVARDEPDWKLRQRIARFFHNAGREDTLLLHISCHGIRDEAGDLYLAASNTDKDLLSGSAIEASWLNEQISRTPSRHKVVLLDCCYSGSFPFGTRARAGTDVNIPAHFEGSSRGVAIITASSALEYAYEGDQLREKHEQPSLFSEAVVEGLATGKADRDGDRQISVDDLYYYVRDRIRDQTPNQTPNMKSELEGPLYVARSVYEPPIVPARLDDQLIALTKHPIAAARLGAVEELGKLSHDNDRAVALAAHQALEQMVRDDSLSVREAVQSALQESESQRVRANAVSPPRARLAHAKSGESLAEVAVSRMPSFTRRLGYLSLAVLLIGLVLAGIGGGSSNQAVAIVGFLLLIGGAGGLFVTAVRAVQRKRRRRS